MTAHVRGLIFSICLLTFVFPHSAYSISETTEWFCSEAGASCDTRIPADPGLTTGPASSTLFMPPSHPQCVSEFGGIEDVDVVVDITHTFTSDLDINLIHDATTVELFTDVGGAGDNPHVTLDDEAASPITSIACLPTCAGAPFQPEGTLSDFDGQDPAGAWTLDINDDAGGDSGTVNSWSILLTLLDSDEDGVGDCYDFCPGVDNAADTDTDGVVDCLDGCPEDSAKTSPGVCGCGSSDDDSDGDGAALCDDSCPADPGKTSPGVCGCGVSDADADGDSSVDCVDLCPADASKVAPGFCGCGNADTDTDSDGRADCIDGCPSDAAKTGPGACGCGTPDVDTDTDGTLDCFDGCPSDAAKTSAGVCGCGSTDADVNNNGIADCLVGQELAELIEAGEAATRSLKKRSKRAVKNRVKDAAAAIDSYVAQASTALAALNSTVDILALANSATQNMTKATRTKAKGFRRNKRNAVFALEEIQVAL